MSARADSRPLAAPAGLRPAAWVLAAGSLLLLLLFHTEAAAAVQTWRDSTAYGHCFLVLPVAAWLAWERRGAAAGLAARPWPVAALAAVPLGAAWFLAERLGIMEGRQIIAVALVLLLAACVLGPRLWRAFSVPLLYLFFLVPFGGFLVGPLQSFTAHFIDLGLDLLAIPHVVTRFTIEIPEGVFRVAEACAGLRFLIAAIAFGVVYACVIYRSPGRRIAFIAASVVVPVIANGFRALGIVTLGHVLGSAQAASVDHILYGWIFFSLVIVLLILAGLPFRQDAPLEAPRLPVRQASAAPSRLAAAAACVLLLSIAAPAASAMLDRLAEAAQQSLPAGAGARVLAGLVTPSGCGEVAPGRYDCGGVSLAVAVSVFAARSSPAALITARREATGEFEAEEASVGPWTLAAGEPRHWQVTRTRNPDRLAASALWLSGVPETSGLALRLHQARASILGGQGGMPPVLVSVVAGLGSGGVTDADQVALRNFLQAQRIDKRTLQNELAR